MRAALLALLALAACTPTSRDDLARGAARSAVRPVIADRFPGVPLDPAVDCIIDNATADQLLALAGDSLTGPTASTSEIVTRIASRRETLTCLAAEGVPALLQ